MILDILLWTPFTICLLLIAYCAFVRIRRSRAQPNYQGKYVWITGASSGIGEFLAYEFVKCGANVIISARNTKELQRVKKSCLQPQKVQVVPMDMCDYQGVKAITDKLISDLQAKGQHLDTIVENAGVSMRCAFNDYAFKNHIAMFDVNVHGPVNHVKCLLPHLIKHKTGHIVGVTSVAGKLATAYRSSYAGSKHAFIGILDSWRTEFGPFGIKVTNIMPGYIKTNLSINALSSGQGEKFGVTDKNIQEGMLPDKFAKIAVKAMYCGQNEIEISEQVQTAFGVILRNLCPDLIFLQLKINEKNQSKAIAHGKEKAT